MNPEALLSLLLLLLLLFIKEKYVPLDLRSNPVASERCFIYGTGSRSQARAIQREVPFLVVPIGCSIIAGFTILQVEKNGMHDSHFIWLEKHGKQNYASLDYI